MPLLKVSFPFHFLYLETLKQELLSAERCWTTKEIKVSYCRKYKSNCVVAAFVSMIPSWMFRPTGPWERCASVFMFLLSAFSWTVSFSVDEALLGLQELFEPLTFRRLCLIAPSGKIKPFAHFLQTSEHRFSFYFHPFAGI